MPTAVEFEVKHNTNRHHEDVGPLTAISAHCKQVITGYRATVIELKLLVSLNSSYDLSAIITALEVIVDHVETVKRQLKEYSKKILSRSVKWENDSKNSADSLTKIRLRHRAATNFCTSAHITFMDNISDLQAAQDIDTLQALVTTMDDHAESMEGSLQSFYEAQEGLEKPGQERGRKYSTPQDLAFEQLYLHN